MPTYQLRCRSCGATFDVVRPMARIDDPAPCPSGHDDTVRLLTTVSVARSSAAARGQSQSTAAPAGGGGCCGGGCCG